MMQDASEIYWVNGQLNGHFDPRDPGLLSGLSVFETMRTYGLHIFRIHKHYARIERSARSLNIEPPSFEAFKDCLMDKVAADVALRFLITAGGQEVIYRRPMDPASVGRPISLGVLTVRSSDALPGHVKHGSRAEWVLSARQQNVDEVLLCTQEGEILEANRSAFVTVKNGILRVPPFDERRLKSVTLGAVLDAASDVNIPVETRACFLTDEFDEAYVVSTLKGISPVVSIAGKKRQSGGSVGASLASAFLRLIEREAMIAI